MRISAIGNYSSVSSAHKQSSASFGGGVSEAHKYLRTHLLKMAEKARISKEIFLMPNLNEPEFAYLQRVLKEGYNVAKYKDDGALVSNVIDPKSKRILYNILFSPDHFSANIFRYDKHGRVISKKGIFKSFEKPQYDDYTLSTYEYLKGGSVKEVISDINRGKVYQTKITNGGTVDTLWHNKSGKVEEIWSEEKNPLTSETLNMVAYLNPKGKVKSGGISYTSPNGVIQEEKYDGGRLVYRTTEDLSGNLTKEYISKAGKVRKTERFDEYGLPIK